MPVPLQVPTMPLSTCAQAGGPAKTSQEKSHAGNHINVWRRSISIAHSVNLFALGAFVQSNFPFSQNQSDIIAAVCPRY
jgi:hypothetical protein